MPEDFLCLEQLKKHWAEQNIQPYPHQIRTVDRVVNEMGGRALLADEVGLGKTFEAGMILKEYQLRGLACRILILTPASLVNQWYLELTTKFQIDAYVNYYPGCWSYADCTIASIDTAKRDEHARDILQMEYDLLIVDEAHKLKNERTQNFRLVKDIKAKFLLLLTATPIQNDLKELFNLISLLRPALLGSYRGFKSKFIKDRCVPKNPLELRELLNQVMVRNDRKNINISLPTREVQLYPLQLTSEEQDFYESVTGLVRREYLRRVSARQNILNLITLQREICSSTFAAEETLQKMKSDQPADSSWREQLEELCLMALNIKYNQKYGTVREILKAELAHPGSKVIIFTEFLATQEYIYRRLREEGYATLIFNGHFSPHEKHLVLQKFAESGQVLVSTESGGEGLNMQFCNVIINYDLPWNPMRVEQRIGRIHRLGQTKIVQIYNLCTKDTIEELILHLMHKKINMFREVIGSLELVLHKLETDKSFESRIMDIIMQADSREKMNQKIDELGSSLEKTRVGLERRTEAENALWGAY